MEKCRWHPRTPSADFWRLTGILVLVSAVSALVVMVAPPLAFGILFLAFMVITIWLTMRDGQMRATRKDVGAKSTDRVSSQTLSRTERQERESRQFSLVWWGLAPILTVLPLFALLYYYFG